MTINSYGILMVFFLSQTCAAESSVSFDDIFPSKTEYTEEGTTFIQYSMSEKDDDYTFPRAIVACSNNKDSIQKISGYKDKMLPDYTLGKLCPLCQAAGDVNRTKVSDATLKNIKFSAREWSYFGESFEFSMKNKNADSAYQTICISSVFMNEKPYILVSECSNFYAKDIILLKSIIRNREKLINNACAVTN